MKTTIGITTELLKEIEKTSRELSFKFKGEGVSFSTEKCSQTYQKKRI